MVQGARAATALRQEMVVVAALVALPPLVCIYGLPGLEAAVAACRVPWQVEWVPPAGLMLLITKVTVVEQLPLTLRLQRIHPSEQAVVAVVGKERILGRHLRAGALAG